MAPNGSLEGENSHLIFSSLQSQAFSNVQEPDLAVSSLSTSGNYWFFHWLRHMAFSQTHHTDMLHGTHVQHDVYISSSDSFD